MGTSLKYYAIEKLSKPGHSLQDYLFSVQTLEQSISLLCPNPESLKSIYEENTHTKLN